VMVTCLLAIAALIAQPGPARVAAQTVTLDYTLWGHPSVFEAAVVEAVEKANPDIKINIISGGGINGYIDKLMTMALTGTPPDVFGLNVQNTERFYSMGVALPLDPYIERDSFDLDAFIPGS